MARISLSIKHLQISKANRAVIVATSAAVVVLVFGVFLTRAMLQRQGHQSRVITAKETAVKQLKANIDATNQIVESYRVFTSTDVNFLGGDSTAELLSDRDGDNARLVLDALPSKYDFPALATSLEKILTDNNYKIESILGKDDELAQAEIAAQGSPQPVEMPFTVSVNSSYGGIQQLIQLFEKSIRPFKFQTMELSGGDSNMTLNLQAVTYYQPEKTISITKEPVR